MWARVPRHIYQSCWFIPRARSPRSRCRNRNRGRKRLAAFTNSSYASEQLFVLVNERYLWFLVREGYARQYFLGASFNPGCFNKTVDVTLLDGVWARRMVYRRIFPRLDEFPPDDPIYTGLAKIFFFTDIIFIDDVSLYGAFWNLVPLGSLTEFGTQRRA